MKEEGIIHLWQLPNIWVKLEEEFRKELMNEFLKITRTVYRASKLTDISRPTITKYWQEAHCLIRIDYLMKIVNEINHQKYSREYTEKKVIWIGSTNSPGIENPKLPFNFNSRPAARFLAAICNDGWISDGACYSNYCDELRSSVIKDTVQVFGGNKKMISEFIDNKDQYLRFPSVIRDVLCLITDFKGRKSENNPRVPSFIRKNEELICGWIEQTIADEGHVMHYPSKRKREISWRRCFSKKLDRYNLIEDEKKMVERIGIDYNFYDNEEYITSKGKERAKLQLSITRRKNLMKFRSLIKIPHSEKDKAFSNMLEGYTRHKIKPRIKQAIIDICKEKGKVTSLDLQEEMNYKNTLGGMKWLNHFVEKGLLEKIQDGSPGCGKQPYNFRLKEETTNVIN